MSHRARDVQRRLDAARQRTAEAEATKDRVRERVGELTRSYRTAEEQRSIPPAPASYHGPQYRPSSERSVDLHGPLYRALSERSADAGDAVRSLGEAMNLASSAGEAMRSAGTLLGPRASHQDHIHIDGQEVARCPVVLLPPNDDEIGKRMAKGSATLAAQQRIADGKWADHGKHEATVDGWEVFTTTFLGEDEVYVDMESARLYLTEPDWRFTEHTDETERFVREMAEGASGMKRMVKDAGKYREWALAEQGEPRVTEDRLADLQRKANGLLVQAASLNEKASAGQLGVFSERLGEIREEYAAIADELAQLEGLIGLAATAVMDASEE